MMDLKDLEGAMILQTHRLGGGGVIIRTTKGSITLCGVQHENITLPRREK